MADHIITLTDEEEAIAASIPDFDVELRNETVRQLEKLKAAAMARELDALKNAVAALTLEDPKVAAIKAILEA